MAVSISNSPVFTPTQHKSIFRSSTLSPRSRVSPSSTPFRQTITGDGPSKSGNSPILKRKRPAKLDIPIMNMGFGDGPMTTRGVPQENVEEEIDGVYSVCCKKGRRAVMEDSFSAVVDIQGHSKQAFFGVFDGHGGAKAAEYAAQNLNKNIIAEVAKKDESTVEEAIKHGYLKTDSDFLEEEVHGGSCCVTAFITEGDLIVSNVGDCRAVLSRGGVAEALTTDHKPSRQDEKSRIETLGGYVDCYNGVWRIQGSLAVSRGIGDRQLKQWVIAEPDTKIVKINSEDEFLILASDGLWDKVTNQEAVDIARPLCTRSNRSEALLACKKLVDLSVSRGSLDDVSVMVIRLPQYMQ